MPPRSRWSSALPEAIPFVTATGRRKSAVARVRLRPGTGQILVNGRPMAEDFPRDALHTRLHAPFEATNLDGRYDVQARVDGGGVAGQDDALRHGISRALEKLED